MIFTRDFRGALGSFALGSFVLGCLLSGCGSSGPSVRDVVQNPERYHGRDLQLAGERSDARWIAEAGVFAYTLVSGRDSLLVLDPQDSERWESGSSEFARVNGRVHRRFVIEGQPRVVLLRGLQS